MKILLVYPRYPDTFWSFRHALKFVGKKASHPPLGLLTVASLLPLEWEKKLVDMNADVLKDKDIAWADYVFVSAMDVQRQSAHEVVRRCRQLNAKLVAGGPLFTTAHRQSTGRPSIPLNNSLFCDTMPWGICRQRCSFIHRMRFSSRTTLFLPGVFLVHFGSCLKCAISGCARALEAIPPVFLGGTPEGSRVPSIPWPG